MSHTPGPLKRNESDVALIGLYREVSRGVIMRIADVFPDAGEDHTDNARLLAAAYTSYDKHCGPRAVEAAEGDLLGEALDALRYLTDLYEYSMLPPSACSKIDAVLSKIKY